MNENINIYKDSELSHEFGFGKKLENYIANKKEYFIKGFQLNNCYTEDWDRITSIFSSYGHKLNVHGPIITINSRWDVELADGIVKSMNITDRNEARKLFLIVLCSLPKYCLETAKEGYIDWLKKKDSNYYKLMGLEGTVKLLDVEVQKIMKDVISNE